MSGAEGKSDKEPDEIGGGPTRSFDGSVKGPGGQIGPFRIERELGRGAVGVVYLAHDTKLDRQVAIKSLPAEVMANPKARSRFAREAKVLASLNHPNIATIYEQIEEAEGVGYLVLEYVPGRTLAERIASGTLKLEETLTIALQIAEAVSAAHEHDVIHRDLKPGNIKITPEGKVKVLDFGLAKAVGGEALDQQSTVTEPGRVIGTPAYMSSEQARGKPTDKRGDIWSFGCVLYEMLTGKIPFRGETVSDTLANILQTEPNWHALPESTPANILVLLRRCLTKDPRRRLRDIGDAAIEINETQRLTVPAPAITTPSSVSFESAITPKPKLRRMAMIIGAAIIIVLTAIVVRFIPKEPTLPASTEIRLVVLPFENLGPAEDEYFAAGITDAITARLAVIRGLGVISRQSAIQYKDREKSAQQIGKELRVNYILEGTVQRERPSDPTSRVRIIPQLIRASDDTHVWADTYDDDMSEVFRLQSDLAEQVAQALDITLLEPERKALASRPTENIEAYEYYLQGNVYGARYFVEENLRIAAEMYEKAVELDPDFAVAYAALSFIHANLYFSYGHSEDDLAKAKEALDKAIHLEPDRTETHMAQGKYYYFCSSDYDKARDQFLIVRRRQPNNAEAFEWIGYTLGMQGKWEEAQENSEKALKLDPLNHKIALNIAFAYYFMHQYDEAERYVDRTISLAPDIPVYYVGKSRIYLKWKGNTEKARAVLEEALQNIKSLAEDPIIIDSLVDIDVYDKNYQEALGRLSLKSEDTDDSQYSIPRALRYAQIYGYMNKKELAKKYYEEARNILEAKIKEQPEDARFHSSLGIAYAGLGRKEDAIREGKFAVEQLPLSKEAIGGALLVEDLARIYVMVGEYDAAIDQLEFLLSIPSFLSIPFLRLDPAWDPLRDHPRFRKLLEGGK